MSDQPQRRQFGFQRRQFAPRVVATGVVDENHLVGASVEHGGDLARQIGGVAGFVLHRDDYAEFDAFGQGSRVSRPKRRALLPVRGAGFQPASAVVAD